MTLLLKLCALALAAAVLGVFLREQRSALALPLQTAALLALLGLLLAAAGERVASFVSVLQNAPLPVSLPQTLLKGAAVCLLSEFCAALCLESGFAAAAQALSFAGRLLVVLLCLPLFEELIETVTGLISS